MTGFTFVLGIVFALSARVNSGRAVELEVVVDAPPATVYALWTTPAGVAKFFAPASRIDPREGGEYTIIFYPDLDPDGASYGSQGAHFLRLVPDRFLSFEWTTFTNAELAGASGPPYDPALRAERPIPTWVEVTLTPLGEHQTRVHLAHRGFRSGGKWDDSYKFFERAWGHVLDGLKKAVTK